MKKFPRTMAFLLAMVMACSFVLSACTPADSNPSSSSSSSSSSSKWSGTEYTEDLIDGYNQVTFYWTYNGTYENCDIWIWWGDVAGKGYPFENSKE